MRACCAATTATCRSRPARSPAPIRRAVRALLRRRHPRRWSAVPWRTVGTDVPAQGLGGAATHPGRRDLQLRPARRRDRRAERGPRGRPRQRRRTRSPIVVPCHRVIGADGSLTGFGGGLPRKRWLLTPRGRRLQGEPRAEAAPAGAGFRAQQRGLTVLFPSLARGSVASEHGTAVRCATMGRTAAQANPRAPDSPPSHVASLPLGSSATPPLAREGRSRASRRCHKRGPMMPAQTGATRDADDRRAGAADPGDSRDRRAGGGLRPRGAFRRAGVGAGGRQDHPARALRLLRRQHHPGRGRGLRLVPASRDRR